MLNRIIRFSLNNRLAVAVVTALILVAGVATVLRMDVDIFPDLNAPTVVVMTEAPGFAAEEVEQLVSYPIETAVNGSSGVRRVRSTSTAGFSVVWVEFDWNTDIYTARQIVAERLDAASELMPAGAGKPVMGPQSSILGEMMIIGLRSDTVPLQELRRIADGDIRTRLLALGGVSQVSVIGGEAAEYQIKLRPEAMNAYGVSVSEVLDATQGSNNNAGGGAVYDFGNEYIVKARISTSDCAELEKAVVRSGPEGIITLGDVASVERGGRMPRIGTASVEAEPAVLITVTKQPGADTRRLTASIDTELDKIERTLPQGITVSRNIFRQSDFIDSAIGNLRSSLAEGALFVIIVLFIFLMNARTTIISVTALPLSILVSVLILHAMGYTINTMSLGGIAIAIGCLVDDAIVDVENVYRNIRANRALPEGERRPLKDVVFEASAEVRMPIFNSTLIVAAAFLPLFFLTGMEGRMLKPLGVAFLVSLGASTIVALTLTPVLCSWLLGNRSQNERLSREPALSRAMKGAYSRSLNAVLRRPRPLMVFTGLLFTVAAVLFFTLGRGFLPSFNEGSFTINVSTLPGISLDESDRIGRVAEQIILDTPEVLTVARKTGRAELDEHALGVNTSEMEAPYRLEDRSRAEFAADLRQRLGEIPGVVVEIGQPISHRIDAMLSGTQSQVAIKIFGDDLATLVSLGNRVKEIVEDVDGAVDVNVEQLLERPELIIEPRRELLAAAGVRLSDFGATVATALSGTEVGQVYDRGIAYPLSVILDEDSRSSIESIGNIPVATAYGTVPLADIADISVSSGPGTVSREGVRRRITVSSNVEGRDLVGTVAEIERRIDEQIELPEGYSVVYGGQFENSRAASRTLTLLSLAALLIIFMLLCGEFHSVAQALVILVNIPLAMIGGIFMLAIFGGELNIPAIIGFISLMGICTRGGMLLISHYNGLKAAGMALDQRIAVGSADRLLPIVMTALTSALALIPLAVRAGEPGNEIQAPMALVILGGLVTSTVLNIYVVPALYRYIEIHRKNI